MAKFNNFLLMGMMRFIMPFLLIFHVCLNFLLQKKDIRAEKLFFLFLFVFVICLCGIRSFSDNAMYKTT